MNKEPSDPPSPDADLWEALARYIAGESPAEEAAEVREWLAADPRRLQFVDALDRSMQRLADRATGVEVEAALQRVKSRIDDARSFEPGPSGRVSAERFNRGWSTTLIRMAAAVILVLGVSVVWRSARKQPTPGAVAAAQVFTTVTGQIDSVYLSDGTTVILAPGSRLRVAQGYGSRGRSVELDGEALFDVEHDANRPFSVRANGATIRDIGTTFVVRNVAAEAVRVAVTQGSVVLYAAGRQERGGVVLKAGDRAVLNREGNVVAQRGGVTDEDMAFTSGRLVFADATLAEVAAQLRRWYGLELRFVDNELAGRHLTAAFDGESAQQVLTVIGMALGARIDLNGDTALVRSSR